MVSTEPTITDPFHLLRTGAESHEKVASLRLFETYALRQAELERMLSSLDIPYIKTSTDDDIATLAPGMVRVGPYVFIHTAPLPDGGLVVDRRSDGIVQMGIGMYYPHEDEFILNRIGQNQTGPVSPVLTWIDETRTKEAAQALVWGVMQQVKSIHEAWVRDYERMRQVKDLVDEVVMELINTLGRAYNIRPERQEDQKW